jgi:hypothetical protein
MRNARDFLRQECANLRSVLDDTLRFKFGLDGSKEFYEECVVRLRFLEGELKVVVAADISAIQEITSQVLELSGLIARIERSSISEYSWPFVEELKRIAVGICTEETLTNPRSPPKIHVLADGGISKYQIYTESNRPSSAGRRILTIIFPRSLKHFVLLHSILGHEIGHAMWQCSRHQRALKDAAKAHLHTAGPFTNVTQTTAWLYSANAPDQLKATLAFFGTRGIDASNLFNGKKFGWATWDAWVEEIICDLVGLVTFGPSFLAAACSLLCTLDPRGAALGPRHPPVGCRINYLLTAASVLGMDTADFGEPSIDDAHKKLWASFRERGQANSWFDVFRQEQIKGMCKSLMEIMTPLSPALYSTPSARDLSHLVEQINRGIPPNGFQVNGANLNCRSIDFRHVLLAGWMVSARNGPESFEPINRLCEHGIMQQRAIDLSLSIGN